MTVCVASPASLYGFENTGNVFARQSKIRRDHLKVTLVYFANSSPLSETTSTTECSLVEGEYNRVDVNSKPSDAYNKDQNEKKTFECIGFSFQWFLSHMGE